MIQKERSNYLSTSIALSSFESRRRGKIYLMKRVVDGMIIGLMIWTDFGRRRVTQ